MINFLKKLRDCAGKPKRCVNTHDADEDKDNDFQEEMDEGVWNRKHVKYSEGATA